MGQALIMKDGIKESAEANNRTLQSAYKNGVLSDAKVVELTDSYHINNQPHEVDTTSENIPDDLSWGVREVFFQSNSHVILSITGLNKSGEPSLWFSSVVVSGSKTTVSDWQKVSMTKIFSGASASAGGSSGLVPSPSSGDNDKCLMGDGTWDYPKHTSPITSVKNNSGTITVTYADGTSETLTQTDSSNYVVTETDKDGNTVKVYRTTVESNGNLAVSTSDK
jgi:hypothetical protein